MFNSLTWIDCEFGEKQFGAKKALLCAATRKHSSPLAAEVKIMLRSSNSDSLVAKSTT
jgi:hypothetical protein